MTTGPEGLASAGTDIGRRPAFKLPAPLNTNEDVLDRVVWSPNRRSSSITGNGDRRSNSPRTTAASSLLGPQAFHGSGSSSPKAATPTKFEDPLLAMPSFRRSVHSGSPSLDAPSLTSPLPASPSFGASLASSNSFSARRTGKGFDFRRSVPGGTPGSAVPGTAEASPAIANRHARGASEYGGSEYTGALAYSLAGSESGGLGGDDDDEDGPDLRVVDDSGPHCTVSRRHSAMASPAAMAAAAAAAAAAASISAAGNLSPITHQRLAMRSTIAVSSGGAAGREEEDDFQARLQLNRHSWRARGHTIGATALIGGVAGGASGGGGEGLQNKTHAALQQLRGELKSLSLRSMNSVPGTAVANGAVHNDQGTTPPLAKATSLSGQAAAAAAGSGACGGGGSGGGTQTVHSRLFDGPHAHPATLPSPSRLSISRSSVSAAATGAAAAGAGSSP